MTISAGPAGFYGPSLLVTERELRWLCADGRVEARPILGLARGLRYEEGDRSIELRERVGSELVEASIARPGAADVAILRRVKPAPGPMARWAPLGGRWDGGRADRARVQIAAVAKLAFASIAGEEVAVRGAPRAWVEVVAEGARVCIEQGRLSVVALGDDALPSAGHARDLAMDDGEVVAPALAALRGLPPIGVRIGGRRFLTLWQPSPPTGGEAPPLLVFLTPPDGYSHASLTYLPRVRPDALGAEGVAVELDHRPARLWTRTAKQTRHGAFDGHYPIAHLRVLVPISGREDGAVLEAHWATGPIQGFAEPPAPAVELITAEVRDFVVGLELFPGS